MRSRIGLSCLVCGAAVLAVFMAHAADEAAQVKTAQGIVAGTVSGGGVRSYKGIPFAQPPVGKLRWTAPLPPLAWTGVKRADHYGASCIQAVGHERLPWTKEFMVQGQTSEDCLYLNVWTSAKTTEARLPVFVFIHGGGFSEGGSDIQLYDGESLATKGVVVVTMNYRLGILGYLAHPELTAESPHHASGNYGLLDQRAALEWVQKNIAGFGGDGNRVAVGGQSAGAISVHELVASPLSKGLFQRAIAESGTSLRGFPTPSLAEAEASGVKLAGQLGADSLKALRALPADKLIPKPGIGRTGPDVDGYFLKEDPSQAFVDGAAMDVPTITGMQADDLLGPAPKDVDGYRKTAHDRYKEMADEFLQTYPAGSVADVKDAYREAARDRGRFSMYLWGANRAKAAKTKLYTYYFAQAIPWPAHPEFGAFHTGEIPYVFRNLKMLDRPFVDVDFQVSDTVSTYWAQFFAKGDPNGNNLPRWVAFDPGKQQTLRIGAKTQMIELASAKKAEFWQKYFNSPASKNAAMF